VYGEVVRLFELASQYFGFEWSVEDFHPMLDQGGLPKKWGSWNNVRYSKIGRFVGVMFSERRSILCFVVVRVE
jgi:hypothetical protein